MNRLLQNAPPCPKSSDDLHQLELRDVIEFELDARPVVPWRTKGDLSISTRAPASIIGVSFTVFCEGASDPVAEGDLEVFHGAPEGTQYWSGEATELPEGPCEVALVAATAEGELPCAPSFGDDDSFATSIRAGWTTYASFACEW